jgi:hypothetical protein
MPRWAKHNPITWDNPDGWDMFNSIVAFGKERGETLTQIRVKSKPSFLSHLCGGEHLLLSSHN